MNVSSVIDKIKKLQALANNNANINESYAATQAYTRLMNEHRISQATLEAAGEIKSETFIREPVYITLKRSSWRERIVSALCADYGACWYISHLEGGKKAYIVCAKESDAAIIAYLFSFCTEEGERLTRANGKGQGLAWSKSYIEGYSVGLAAQLKEARLAEKSKAETANALLAAIGQSASSAMVLLDTRRKEAQVYMNECIGITRKAGSLNGSRSNESAYGAGERAGRTTSVRRGMNGGGAKLLT